MYITIPEMDDLGWFVDCLLSMQTGKALWGEVTKRKDSCTKQSRGRKKATWSNRVKRCSWWTGGYDVVAMMKTIFLYMNIYIYAYIYNILLVGCQPTIIIGGHAAFLSVAAVAGWLGERRGHGLISIVECSYSSSIGCETSLFEAYPLYEFVDFWRLFLLQHIPTWA